MKRKLLMLLAASFIAQNGFSQNNYLAGSVNGDINEMVLNIEFVYDGADLVMLAGTYEKSVYAIDWNASSATGVHDWTQNDIPNFMTTVSGLSGIPVSNLVLYDLEVNPKTKSAVGVILANQNSTFLVEAKSQNDISILSLTNLTYSKMVYSTIAGADYYLFDMTMAPDDNLYVSVGDYTLDSELTVLGLPFTHNAVADSKGTTLYKSNWGGGYFTEAPLELIVSANISGVDRLMGVTVCAPGFSIPLSDITSSTGTLTVQEDFNINTSVSRKLVVVTQQASSGPETSYLFDLHHDNQGNHQLIRIGERFIDGSPQLAGETNNNAQMIRNLTMNISSNLTDQDAKILSTGFKMIGKYSNYELMVLDGSDVLRLMNVTSEFLSLDEIEMALREFEVTPVPSSSVINIDHSGTDMTQELTYSIVDLSGKVMDKNQFNGQGIDISNLSSGQYIIYLNDDKRPLGKGKFIKA